MGWLIIRRLVVYHSGSTSLLQYVQSADSSEASKAGFLTLEVTLLTQISSLPPQYSPFLKDRNDLISALEHILLQSVTDFALTEELQKIALETGAQAMFVANVTSVQVKYVQEDSSHGQAYSVFGLNSMSRLTFTEVIKIIRFVDKQ